MLVQAFNDQTDIGWDQLLRGRISKRWTEAFMKPITQDVTRKLRATSWAKLVVKALWEYSISLWKFRNGEVYGHTIEEGKEKEWSNLQHRVGIEYGLYAEDPFIVSPQFATLFTRKTLQERREMDRDSLACWLRSVEEAKWHQSEPNISNLRKSHLILL